MKTLTLIASGLAFALASGAANAADLSRYDPAPTPVYAVPYTWTGFYAGVNAGMGGGTFRHPFTVGGVEVLSANVTASGFIFGAQVGYNMQFDNVVAGVEADFQWSNVRGQLNFATPTAAIALGTEVNWFGTLRARLGYTPVDRLMVYGTGGLAYGDVNSYARGSGTAAALNVSSRTTRWGWTVGAGAEYAFTDTISLKTEYLYTDLGRSNIATFGAAAPVAIDRRVSFHTVRAGLNFHF